MELIVTHVGADFDAFAAMLAAQRLHPAARLFFPGSREESLRRALAGGIADFAELRRKDVDPQRLERLILCDIRQRDRIGVVADWLSVRPDLEVWAYDHHPPTPEDVVVSGGLIDPEVGATATLMVEELGRRGKPIDAGLATVLLLGIYEDTGALTYATSRARDARAVARLLELGGDLAAIRRYTQRSLDASHLAVLHRMIEGLEIHRLRGHRVGLVALELGSYVEELAPLVSRCLELHSLSLLVAVLGEGERVTVIARGEIEGVDLGMLLAPLGGGGHATAAAGSLRGATVVEVRERVLEVLARSLPPLGTARDLMVTAFVAIEADRSVEEAKALMVRGRVNAAPVMRGGRVVGSVSRHQLDAAIQHDLGNRPIETAMSSEVRWIAPEATSEETAEALLRGGPAGRFALVGDAESGRAIGLVSRLAVMSQLYSRVKEEGNEIDRRIRTAHEHHRQIGRLLSERVPDAIRRRLDAIREVAAAEQVPVFAVGGFVRDLLLGRANEDLDLVVEGDGTAFARALARRLGGRAREHPAFLTAVVIDAEGFAVDVASARSEFYRAPAALPEVQSSVLRQDLYRRDFTINTLAIRLGLEHGPELVDFFGGVRDLEERSLRVLHSLSFLDDPTRMLRAVRFELRLGFHLSAEARRLVEVALSEGAFARLSPERLREELALLLELSEHLPRAVERLEELGLLRGIHPQLRFDSRLQSRLEEVSAVLAWSRLAGLQELEGGPWLLALFALAQDLEPAALQDLADRLGLAGQRRDRLIHLRERLEPLRAQFRRADGLLPHAIVESLTPLESEELLLLMADAPETGQAAVRRYLVEWRRFRPSLHGRDLVAVGWPAGPKIGAALRAVAAARLDEKISEADELDYALAFLARLERETDERVRGGGK